LSARGKKEGRKGKKGWIRSLIDWFMGGKKGGRTHIAWSFFIACYVRKGKEREVKRGKKKGSGRLERKTDQEKGLFLRLSPHA